MSAPERLRDLQRWFALSIAHPEGAARGSIDAGRLLGLDRDRDRGVEGRLTAGPRSSAVERLQIYNDAYFSRLVECLADDYPALQHALGEDVFTAVAREYIEQNPSRSPSLNVYGRRMAAFCRKRPEPWAHFASDLARLEWALVEVIHASAPPALGIDDLSAVPAARWPRARLVPSPALAVLAFEYPVNRYFQAFREHGAPHIPQPEASATVVYRQGLKLWRIDLDADAAPLLDDLVSGVALGPALLALESRVSGRSLPAELGPSVQRWLHSWVESGLFTAIEFD